MPDRDNAQPRFESGARVSEHKANRGQSGLGKRGPFFWPAGLGTGPFPRFRRVGKCFLLRQKLLKIARRFNAGKKRQGPSPAETAESNPLSTVPTGLIPHRLWTRR